MDIICVNIVLPVPFVCWGIVFIIRLMWPLVLCLHSPLLSLVTSDLPRSDKILNLSVSSRCTSWIVVLVILTPKYHLPTHLLKLEELYTVIKCNTVHLINVINDVNVKIISLVMKKLTHKPWSENSRNFKCQIYYLEESTFLMIWGDIYGCFFLCDSFSMNVC